MRETAMRHEHLVEINKHAAPDAAPLTRRQLWNGLVLRAEDPVPFVEAMDRCVILERSNAHLERELHFGPARIRDRVVLTAPSRVRYEVYADEHQPGGTLEMAIESDDGGALYVRFTYVLPPGGPASTSEEQAALLRRAYEASDVQTVRTIFAFAAENRLD